MQREEEECVILKVEPCMCNDTPINVVPPVTPSTKYRRVGVT